MLDFGKLFASSMPLAITSMKTSVGEFQRNYLFKLVVEDYPLSLNQAYSNAPALASAVDLYLVKGVWPNRKTSSIAVKWSGETYYHSGVDESTKTGQLNFRLDESMAIKDFFEAAKDLTGNLYNHAAVNKPAQVLTLGVYMVNVGKDTVTDYRRLVDVLVYSVDAIELGKESDGLSTFNVDISWDRQERDNSKRGQKI